MRSFYLAGNWKTSDRSISVFNPFDAKEIDQVALANTEDVEKAIHLGLASFQETKKLTSFEKSKVLSQVISGILEKKEEFVSTIIKESGKPRKYAEGEVNRAVQTFVVAKEEAKRLNGEIIPLDWTSAGKGKKGYVQPFPIGLVAGISPFNFPLNLVAHKVAPAIASGCPIILKPASKTPLTALLLAEILENTEWPNEAFSVLPCDRETGSILVENEKISLLSFTGSPAVGWEMKKQAGKKKVVLELGGNAAAIIDKDQEVNQIIPKLITGSFAYSGQVCIHTQRIYVHESRFDSFLNEFVNRTSQIKIVNPAENTCEFSSMISEKEAKRVESWISEAVEGGATLMVGGIRTGNLIEPTILTGTNENMKVVSEEVFGPVVLIEKYQEESEAIELVNQGKFGLQASIFSNNHSFIKKAFNQLEVGAVIVNESTTFRVDHMPYGGIKDSGIGREGVKYAMQDMLEMKLLVD